MVKRRTNGISPENFQKGLDRPVSSISGFSPAW